MRSSASPTPETPLVQKRRRSSSDPAALPFSPRVGTDFVDVSSHEHDRALGARSPRSVVAERLSDLQINGPLPAIHFDGVVGGTHAGNDQCHKRVKVTTTVDDTVMEEEDGGADTPPKDMIIEAGEPLSIRESGLQPRQKRFMSPPAGGGTSSLEIQMGSEPAYIPLSARDPSAEPTNHPSSALTPTSRPLQTFRPPPRPIATTEPPTEGVAVTVPSSTPSLAHRQKPLKRPAENTNHEATTSDYLDPDDDGTGINGIGFRPTPAEAWARTQRRRKQLSEWRARETREARQRRSERRNRSEALIPTADVAMEDTMTERPHVRFAP